MLYGMQKARRHTTPDLENTTERTIELELFQVVFELAAAARMAQLAQRLRLDLADALAGHFELFADFFERAAAAIVQPEAQAQHLSLALGQAAERVLDLLLEQLMAGGLGWGERALILDEVAQVAVVFLADRRLQADRLLARS